MSRFLKSLSDLSQFLNDVANRCVVSHLTIGDYYLLIFWLLPFYDFPLQLKHLHLPIADSISSRTFVKTLKKTWLGVLFTCLIFCLNNRLLRLWDSNSVREGGGHITIVLQSFKARSHILKPEKLLNSMTRSYEVAKPQFF